ncbi:TPA: methyl-accepting chemotaxis protein [Enterobacter ludwigii]|uniref:methyl-accepting chemotaxis protein n=1 Tax=Enterobacter TaxID=547 RepID=UPI0015F7635F|nr:MULTISPECIES: methyl-accepting chemotaxis protein [Enterobacter]MBA7773725.1 methyl-accepting chemotaxis protein [Enterobacter sp. RHBSTW-00974]MBA7778888.1 methyl-accepting chemotaxis protein [Enterobacter sp. RHBSTW-00318]MBA7831491.1 methyl-accepting chemotaxis protein [Enterobacter sp. RHBSTW-00340]MBA8039008.1 methyl-accepting chemotaxis protein [Enterobacter sp. RHBSTW-00131]MBG0585248.1 methyl-accepting chemotaxis protein [Enterobacter ludwigii]
MFTSLQSRAFLLVSAFFLLLTALTVWVVLNFVAPQLLKNEYRRVHHEIGEQAAAITQLMSRVEAQQRTITETVSRLDSADIDRLLPALVDQYGDATLFGGGVWPLPGKREPGIEKYSTFFARDAQKTLRLNTTWNQPDAPAYWQQPWFKAGMRAAKGQCAWAEAYMDAASPQPRTNCAMPIYRDGQLWGVATLDVTLGFFNQLARKMAEPLEGGVLIVEASGKIVAYSRATDNTPALKNISEIPGKEIALLQAMLSRQVDGHSEQTYDAEDGEHTIFLYPIAGSPWFVATDTRSSVLSKQTRDILVRLAMVQIPLLLLLAGVLLLSVRILMRNLQGVGERLAALSAGGADLTRRLPESGTQELNAIATHVNTFMNYLQGLLQQVGASTRTIAAASHQIADGNLSLSSRTEEQSASLTQTAASMEEIAGIVANNADNAEHADRLATQAAGIARRGAALMNAAVDKMGHIESSSARVADIVGVIDGIAYQTNILALNAAVEAARAGEQGRGFAVVATEVRNLALRSSSSAKEIRELINEAVSGVQDGSRLVQDAGETMNALVTSVGEVSTLMEEVKTASREQRAGIEQVNVAVCQLEGATQQNTTLVAELSSAAKAMEEQSMELENVVKRFNV